MRSGYTPLPYYTSDPCFASSGGPWSGVMCTKGTDGLTHITGLSLASYGLKGALPDSLGSLTLLSSLLINNNKLSSTIPSALGGATALTMLYIYSNSLTGTMPVSLGLLSKLNYLNLQSNSLTGPIPEALCVQFQRTSGGSFYFTVTANSLLQCYPACMSPAKISSTYFVKDASLARICGTDYDTFQAEMQMLNDLYTATTGISWTYAGNSAARKWDFSKRPAPYNYYLYDPCASGTGAFSGVTCKTMVPKAVPLIRPSEIRTMSLQPATANFLGIGM
jgi:hypothetical protein